MPQKSKKYFDLSFAKAWLDSDGIFNVYFKPDCDIGMQESRQFEMNVRKLCGSTPAPTLYDIRDIGYVREETLGVLYSEYSNEMIKALAVLLTAPSIRMRFMINAMLLVKKFRYPIKVFIDQKKAMEWLRQYSTKNGVKKESEKATA